jgi:chorismate mutase
MNTASLKKERKKIDKIDQSIFKLIKKRTIIVKKMLTLKKYKKEIVDHKRINQILNMIKKKSIRNKIDPKITKKIWKSMIWAYVDYQRRNIKRK